MSKIDIIIPLHRGELKDIVRIKKRFDYLESLGDCHGVSYTILGTYSDPQLTVDEIRTVAPSEFFEVKIASNADYESIATEYGFKIKEHYYPITSVTFEWVVRHRSELQKGESFFIFHINDMFPMHETWANKIYQAWCGCGKPFIFGEWCYGNPGSGPGPFIDGMYNWKWSEYRRCWGGWGAYDAELPYIAWFHGLSVVPHCSTAGSLTLNFTRRMAQPLISTADLSWVTGHFNSWVFIFHEFEDKWPQTSGGKERLESDVVFNHIVSVFKEKQSVAK